MTFSFRGFVSESQLPDSNFLNNHFHGSLSQNEEFFYKGLCYAVPFSRYSSITSNEQIEWIFFSQKVAISWR
jgi:hypothetical protein